MVQLYIVDSPINREQRNNLNDTFADIQRRLNSLSVQIGTISNNSDLEQLINDTQETIDNSNRAIAQLEQLLADNPGGVADLEPLRREKANRLQENEITLELSPDFQNIEDDLAYYKDEFGVVHVRGIIRSLIASPQNTPYRIATLPVNYRPEKTFYSSVFLSLTNEVRTVNITSDGNLSVSNPAANAILIIDLMFRGA